EPASTGGGRSERLSGAALTASELAQASGLAVSLVDELESFGLIVGRTVAGVHCFDEDALVVASLAANFARFGIEARHLRLFKHAAERQAGLYSQVVMPVLRQRNPDARRRAHEELAQMSELGASLQACFVESVLRDLTGG
ncbi:MAG: MerR family transcriptional regulator, partial [Actinomycetota bacterium]|nr:MerR family transcriptional regulator [Actinomycetota bacterium]